MTQNKFIINNKEVKQIEFKEYNLCPVCKVHSIHRNTKMAGRTRVDMDEWYCACGSEWIPAEEFDLELNGFKLKLVKKGKLCERCNYWKLIKNEECCCKTREICSICKIGIVHKGKDYSSKVPPLNRYCGVCLTNWNEEGKITRKGSLKCSICNFYTVYQNNYHHDTLNKIWRCNNCGNKWVEI